MDIKAIATKSTAAIILFAMVGFSVTSGCITSISGDSVNATSGLQTGQDDHNSNISNTKKIIEYRWDIPSAGYVKENIRSLEDSLFDGIVFPINNNSKYAFDTRPADWSDMCPEDLAGIEWNKFTDNFIMLQSTNAYDMDWFNDSQWDTIDSRLQLYARAARVSGSVGIAFDPEPYGVDTGDTWVYEGKYSNRSLEEVEKKVRQRGAEFMASIQEEYPDVKLLSLFFVWPSKYNADDTSPEFLTHYALLTAFQCGLLDALSQNATIIDGNEDSYYYHSTDNFYTGYNKTKAIPKEITSTESREKYERQLKVAMAQEIDGVFTREFLPENLSDQYIKALWVNNIYYSLATTDEYVWVFNGLWNDNSIMRPANEGIRQATDKYYNGMPLGFYIDRSHVVRAGEP